MEGSRDEPMSDRARLSCQTELLEADLLGAPAFRLRITFSIKGPLREPRIGVGVNNSSGERVVTLFTQTGGPIGPIEKGETRVVRYERPYLCST